jgi:hypothetical protein
MKKPLKNKTLFKAKPIFQLRTFLLANFNNKNNFFGEV